ncbi:hypothetical protein [Chryseobacterium echinoideorum]|uniref:hypothetical protein n=1 Tax=Chryseobacterium echinoideorum TaxID=1549648 RepID=UPI001184D497|nr:hypothetical protein [Chryseobacterium echinoideorum]
MKNLLKFLVVFAITFALAACHPPPRPPKPPKPPHPRHGSLEKKTETSKDSFLGSIYYSKKYAV